MLTFNILGLDKESMVMSEKLGCSGSYAASDGTIIFPDLRKPE